MVDFSALLRAPAGEAKKPSALPAGDYSAVIKSWEIGDNNKNKTPYVRFHIGVTGWPDHVDEESRQSEGKPIDLSKRQMRRDFFFGDALWRLDEFIRSTGVEARGRTYEEILPELIGAPVIAEVQQYMNEKTSEIGNQIGKLLGTNGQG